VLIVYQLQNYSYRNLLELALSFCMLHPTLPDMDTDIAALAVDENWI
jgi:hypothetical protein